MTHIALLNIGSELLIGRTVNTNASTIGKMLRAAGYHLKTTLVIDDEAIIIRNAIDHLLKGHDVVLITGGLGPTKDDITKKVLLERFGGEMICHEPTLAGIRKYLESRKRRLLESNRQQAFVPSSCTVLPNQMGTAPGMLFKEDGKTVISMPGVPFEMLALMQDQVLPYLHANYANAFVLTRMVRTAGVPESRIAERMEEIEKDFPLNLDVAYLPSTEGTKIELRMSGPAETAKIMEADILATQRSIAHLFSKYTYSLRDERPDQVLARMLLKEGITMGTAESCTGGAIAASMVRNSGISAVLKGGIVAYTPEIKQSMLGVSAESIAENGVVSKEVALEMAEGACKELGCDFAVSITGWAEAAEDAGPEDRPQAWIGFAGKFGQASYRLQLFKGRSVNLEVATNAAIIFAIRTLRERNTSFDSSDL